MASFRTNPIELTELLKNCERGLLQLPDFQRSWVWDEERIKSLIASISRSFPIGALMTLETGGPVNFTPRPVEGAPDNSKQTSPTSLLLDGQQRMTSLYQVSLRGQVVETVTPKNKKVKRWFYIDIKKALDDLVDREEAIVGVPEDKILREDFGRTIKMDLSTPEKEYSALMYPVSQVFNCDNWLLGYFKYCGDKENSTELIDEFTKFKNQVLDNFKTYHVPVISLSHTTSKEAVCVVFEKVNTGGKPLDAFELVTAMYAAEGHELRKDWYGKDLEQGRHHRFNEMCRFPGAESGILANVANTDFLQAISLFHTRDNRKEAEKSGKQGRELPPITGNRKALLNLPLAAYTKYEKIVELGFEYAAKFLNSQNIYRIYDLPYQSQIVPLAAILADIGEFREHDAVNKKLEIWYWNGVFGDAYGSSVDTSVARDFSEVPDWLLRNGTIPVTISETMFRADRLKTMRMRQSAAYKGVNALLMKEGAKDFRSGQRYDLTAFFGENVDIHHIFPQEWCKKQQIKREVYDSIINKTPLSFRTNRIIGGVAPSEYLEKLVRGDGTSPPIPRENIESFISSHLISPTLLFTNNFYEFMDDRQNQLLALIERVIDKKSFVGVLQEEGEDIEYDEYSIEAEHTISGPLN